MNSRNLLLAAAGVIGALVLGPGSAGDIQAARKPGSSTSTWACAATFFDRAGDAILSDGNGAYVNGVAGMQCSVNGNLHLQPGRSSARRIHFVGQSYGGVQYDSEDVAAPDYFEVGDLASAVTPGATYLRPFRATKGGATNVFRGDSFASGTLWDSTSSVFVTPLDPCSWDVAFGTNEPLLAGDGDGRSEPPSTWTDPRLVALYSLTTARGKTVQTFLGNVPMPFKVHIDVIANKPGCPL